MVQRVSPRRGETIRMKQPLQTAVLPATCAQARLQPAMAAVLGRPAQAWTHVALSPRPAGGRRTTPHADPARRLLGTRGGPWGAGWEGGTRGSCQVCILLSFSWCPRGPVGPGEPWFALVPVASVRMTVPATTQLGSH